MSGSAFEIICEVEQSARRGLDHAFQQVEALRGLASAFLVPDNHTGRATVSSIAVVHELAGRGDRAIACVNARDRNLLGFQRDLLTCEFHGIEDLLLVYGDEPEVGERATAMNVRTMLDECLLAQSAGRTVRAAVTTRLAPIPSWKCAASSLFVQVTYSSPDLIAWRDSVSFDGPVYAAVIVLAGARMARRLSARIPQLTVPTAIIEMLERDRFAGVALAAGLVAEIRESGRFDGVHLIPGIRHSEIAAELSLPDGSGRRRAVRVDDDLEVFAGRF